MKNRNINVHQAGYHGGGSQNNIVMEVDVVSNSNNNICIGYLYASTTGSHSGLFRESALQSNNNT